MEQYERWNSSFRGSVRTVLRRPTAEKREADRTRFREEHPGQELARVQLRPRSNLQLLRAVRSLMLKRQERSALEKERARAAEGEPAGSEGTEPDMSEPGSDEGGGCYAGGCGVA